MNYFRGGYPVDLSIIESFPQPDIDMELHLGSLVRFISQPNVKRHIPYVCTFHAFVCTWICSHMRM